MALADAESVLHPHCRFVDVAFSLEQQMPYIAADILQSEVHVLNL